MPAELHGEEANTGAGLPKVKPIAAETIREKMERAGISLQRIAEKQKNYQQRFKKPVAPFIVGDRVLKKNHLLSDKGAKKAKKLGLLYDRTYILTKIAKSNAYVIKKEWRGDRRSTINARQLRPYKMPYVEMILGVPDWETEESESGSETEDSHTRKMGKLIVEVRAPKMRTQTRRDKKPINRDFQILR